MNLSPELNSNSVSNFPSPISCNPFCFCFDNHVTRSWCDIHVELLIFHSLNYRQHVRPSCKFKYNHEDRLDSLDRIDNIGLT